MGRRKEQRQHLGYPIVISEKQFALSYASFWHQVIPMSEEYLRSRNRDLKRFITPLRRTLSANTRGVVNELAFQLFAAAASIGVSVDDLSQEAVDQCVLKSLHHIRDLRERSRTPVQSPDSLQIEEAKVISTRLLRYFANLPPADLIVLPHFAGCGWLDECEGDALSGVTLVEVKAGERGFRSIDLRQVLTYCALNLASQTYEIRRICLINPRVGVTLNASVESLCRDVSGRSSTEVLSEIVQFVSEPTQRYGLV
jgi:hypothetical protein